MPTIDVPTDGPDRLRAELLAALEPFARVARALEGEPDGAMYDCWYVLDGSAEGDMTSVVVPTVGDVRRAAEVYRKARGCGGEAGEGAGRA